MFHLEKIQTNWGVILFALAMLAGGGCATFHSGAMPGEPQGAMFVDLSGVRVRYRDQGKGPAVVLIHGFASSLETWTALAPILAQDHRVISLDLKGFGWSDRPEGDYSPAAQADLVRKLLDQLQIDRADVVAHSWGCAVALQLALKNPQQVNRLVLYDAWVYDAQQPAFFRWATLPALGEAMFAAFYKQRPEDRINLGFYQPDAVPQKLIDDIVVALDRPGTVAAALAAVRGQGFADSEHEYRRIHQHTLLLWGREDGVSLPDFAERLHRDLANSQLQWYGHCGHFPMLEAATASNAAVQQFLAAPQ